MCGGSSPPEDKSAEVAQIQAEQARIAREDEARKQAQAKADFESRLSSAYSTGMDSATNYFSQQGLDPNEYMSDIQNALNSAKSRVPSMDESPGTYFENLGASVYDRLQDSQRSQALRGFDSFARPGFASQAISDTSDDPFLEAILEEQQAEADDYVRRLLDRQVITNTGYDAALADLLKQRPGANARLQDIGLAELERGRGTLRDIAATGRSNASNLRLGDQFDPYSYQSQINNVTSNFFANLANNLRANAPEDLFDSSGLAGIAGYAQGAQNTEFDPDALAGIFGDEEDEEDNPDNVEDEEFNAF